jgi:hypothetical protein
LKYHPSCLWFLTRSRYPGRGHCLAGSLTGAVASQKVTEARKGSLRLIGNQLWSVKAQGSLTARQTSRAGTKVGLSDPAVLYGKAVAQRIKGTPGITGLSLPRVHIDGEVWHLDVGSSHPGAGEGPKGSAVRRSIGVRELGLERRETVRSLSAAGVGYLRGAVPSTRGPGWTNLWCTSCGASRIAG